MALSTNGKWTVTNIAFSVMLLLLTGWFTWLTKEAISNRDFRVQGSRFTDVQGQALAGQLKATQIQLDHLFVQVEKLEKREIPPRWFIGKVNDIEQRMRKLEQKR